MAGEERVIVSEIAGTTRDATDTLVENEKGKFLLIDTAGLRRKSKVDDGVEYYSVLRAKMAVERATVCVIMLDAAEGFTEQDSKVAGLAHEAGKGCVIVVNKCDRPGGTPPEFYEFYNLGLGDPVEVSSVHGHGTGEWLDEVCEYVSAPEEEGEESDVIRVAVIGKPNAGQSSLVNQMAGEERVIVSEIAGTTRDATDTLVENGKGRFLLIDTAGLRRKSRVNERVEHYSVLRAKLAVERATVCVIMIDAVEGFTEQDSKVAGLAHEAGKGCIIAVNKWDAVEKDGKTMDQMRKQLMNDFSFMSYAPIIFISAKTGQRIGRLWDLIKFVDEQNAMRITTGKLNDILAEATARVQPPTDKGRRLKIYYMTQASTRPPAFVCFVNRAELFHYSYQRYLENQIRGVFGLEGTPVRLITREREREDV
jgi:GTP-binding protein